MTEKLTRQFQARLKNADGERSTEFKHWVLRRDADKVLWVLFDKQDVSTNTLNAEVLEEFNSILQGIEDKPPSLVVIHSAKHSGFCAGADISQFTEVKPADMLVMLAQGHGVLDRLENLPTATLAIVHGHCLGGGLELALACQQRIGIRGKLEMGFPEIRLGLHPGLGGSFRLIRLLDPLLAMSLMLTGRSVYESATRKQGLVDELIERRQLENAVKSRIGKPVRRRSRSVKQRLFSLNAARQFAAKKMRSMSEAKAPNKDYPAPFALIELWEKFGGDTAAMQQAEQESFVQLMGTDTARNLIRVFFLQQSLKELATKPHEVQRVHVIGAGAMGGDIAAWCAMRGFRVSLSDQKLEPIARAVSQARLLCERKHRSSAETRDTLDRLIADPDNDGVSTADIIIEAVPEDLQLKQKVYGLVEPKMKPGAILATNTSSIPLDKLAESLARPERFLGLHFFNPVSEMLIVEVVHHGKTDNSALQSAFAFTGAIGKLPVPIASYPGFLVNRALTPYLLEAMMLLDAKVDKLTIDRAAEYFGMPMGPIELADQVGLDVCLHVADMLAASLSLPMARIPDWLREKVQRGELGKKTGEGFYHWKQGKPVEKTRDKARQQTNRKDVMPDQETIDRLMLPMLNACVECYRNGIIPELDQIDGAMVFATGFAPFRGGPMHYARKVGVDKIADRLRQLQEKFGDRFRPDAGWKDMVDPGDTKAEIRSSVRFPSR